MNNQVPERPSKRSNASLPIPAILAALLIATLAVVGFVLLKGGDDASVAETTGTESSANSSEAVASSGEGEGTKATVQKEDTGEYSGVAPSEDTKEIDVEQRPLLAQYSPIEIIGDGLAPRPEKLGDPDRALGKKAPILTATNLRTGNLVTLAPGQDRIVFFFSHWCNHCQVELPQFVEWVEAGNLPEGIEVVAVSTSAVPERGNYPPITWFDDTGFTGTVLADNKDGDALQYFGFQGFPASAAIKADGTIAKRINGSLGPEGFQELVDSLSN